MPLHATYLRFTEINRASCENQLFDEIVELNCNKILGRLGSSRFKRPAHLIKSREPLSTRLRHLLHRLNQAAPGVPRCEDLDSLNEQINNFEASFSRLEKADFENVVPCTKSIVKQAFIMTENGVKLPRRLSALGYPTALLDTRDVREVGKISNYWRISRHLAKCARLFHLNFIHGAWYAVQSYKSSCGSQILRQRFVHAEIQILAYYETTASAPTPRTIGVSKEACFLCDSFIRAHAVFSISGAHRQMVSQWTVPDLKEYSSQSTLRIRRALSQVCQDVTKEYLQSQRKHPRRSFPLQSAINLDIVQLPTPSVSTVEENHPSENAVASTRNSIQSKPTELQDDRGTKFIKSSASSVCCKEMQENGRAPDIRGNKEQKPEGLPITILVDKTISGCTRWVNVAATCLPSPNGHSTSLQPSKSLRCSVTIDPVSTQKSQRIVLLDEIPPGGNIEILRDTSDAPNELSFVLVGHRGEAIQVRCQWHT